MTALSQDNNDDQLRQPIDAGSQGSIQIQPLPDTAAGQERFSVSIGEVAVEFEHTQGDGALTIASPCFVSLYDITARLADFSRAADTSPMLNIAHIELEIPLPQSLSPGESTQHGLIRVSAVSDSQYQVTLEDGSTVEDTSYDTTPSEEGTLLLQLTTEQFELRLGALESAIAAGELSDVSFVKEQSSFTLHYGRQEDCHYRCEGSTTGEMQLQTLISDSKTFAEAANPEAAEVPALIERGRQNLRR